MMTDFLFPVDVVPMSEVEIINPDFEYHHQALKRLNISDEDSFSIATKKAFDYCNSRSLYCVLCVWRDNNWSLCYKLLRGWPENAKPFPGKLEMAYLASKEHEKHFFCIDDDYPDRFPRFCFSQKSLIVDRFI